MQLCSLYVEPQQEIRNEMGYKIDLIVLQLQT
jgi:hypothetical protein